MKTKQTLKLIFGVCVMATLLGCGIKGDPLPPSEKETVQKDPEAFTKKEQPASTSDLTQPPKKKTQ